MIHSNPVLSAKAQAQTFAEWFTERMFQVLGLPSDSLTVTVRRNAFKAAPYMPMNWYEDTRKKVEEFTTDGVLSIESFLKSF